MTQRCGATDGEDSSCEQDMSKGMAVVQGWRRWTVDPSGSRVNTLPRVPIVNTAPRLYIHVTSQMHDSLLLDTLTLQGMYASTLSDDSMHMYCPTLPRCMLSWRGACVAFFQRGTPASGQLLYLSAFAISNRPTLVIPGGGHLSHLALSPLCSIPYIFAGQHAP